MQILNPEDVLQMEFLGNSIQNYLFALSVFIGFLIVLKIFRKVILGRLEEMAKKTKTDVDDQIVHILRNISNLFYWFLAFYLTFKSLNLGANLGHLLDGIFIFLILLEAIKIVQNIIDFAFKKTSIKDATTLDGIKLIVKIVLWAVGILLILSNLGFNISTLAASLGIGGVAIALAAQNILGDLFASFSIYFDKPFQVGDFIILSGGDKGNVKKIGLKTTRIETLQGEELVVSNKELTETRLQNFKKMKKRRISFSIGVTYDTPVEKIKKIPDMIKKIINDLELAEVERVHFNHFGDFNLNIEIVYYVDSDAYGVYMNTQQKINLRIMEQFEKEKIEFAFPTQTLYIKKN